MSEQGSSWRAAFRRYKRGLLLAAIACASLGLAPFVPHPHIYKQIMNLAHGRLQEAMDVFDLVMHGAPWLVLLVILGRVVAARFRGGGGGH